MLICTLYMSTFSWVFLMFMSLLFRKHVTLWLFTLPFDFALRIPMTVSWRRQGLDPHGYRMGEVPVWDRIWASCLISRFLGSCIRVKSLHNTHIGHFKVYDSTQASTSKYPEHSIHKELGGKNFTELQDFTEDFTDSSAQILTLK